MTKAQEAYIKKVNEENPLYVEGIDGSTLDVRDRAVFAESELMLVELKKIRILLEEIIR